jgi:hypothetical protein
MTQVRSRAVKPVAMHARPPGVRSPAGAENTFVVLLAPMGLIDIEHIIAELTVAKRFLIASICTLAGAYSAGKPGKRMNKQEDCHVEEQR